MGGGNAYKRWSHMEVPLYLQRSINMLIHVSSLWHNVLTDLKR